MSTVINFSVATGILALTPENNWLFLTAFVAVALRLALMLENVECHVQ